MLNCHFVCCFEVAFLGMCVRAYFMLAYVYLKHACYGKDQSFHKGTIFVVPKPNPGGNSIFSPPWSTRLRRTPAVAPTVSSISFTEMFME